MNWTSFGAISVCENVPDCDGGVVTNIDTAHRVTYVLAITDFTSDITVTQIKLTSMTATGDLEFRGNKIGEALFEETIKAAKKIDAKLMTWQVLDWNEPALNFYKKFNAEMDPEWINGKIRFE